MPIVKMAMANVRQIERPMTSLTEQIIGIVMALTRRYDVPIQKASVVEPPMSLTIACHRHGRISITGRVISIQKETHR